MGGKRLAKMAGQTTWNVGVVSRGLEQPGFIDEEIGSHPAVRFRFFPMIPEQTEDVMQRRERESSAAKSRMILGQELSRRIAYWDLKDETGKTVPINEENCRRLRITLQTKMWHIVLGLASTDIDPEWSIGAELLPLDDLESLSEQVGK